MSLGIEYFIDQTHITDLQKLKDQELYFIIRLFRDEIKKFNQFDGFQLKGLIIACNEMKDLIKDFRFILNGYLKLINENNNNLTLASLTDIEGLLFDINSIEIYLDKIKTVRLVKAKVKDSTDICLYKMRVLYDSLSDFIFMEIHLWENYSTLD